MNRIELEHWEQINWFVIFNEIEEEVEIKKQSVSIVNENWEVRTITFNI